MARDLADLLDDKELAKLERRYGRFPRRHFELTMPSESLDFYARLFRKRRGEILFVLQREDGQVLLHTKAGYPDEVFRLPGGGIEWDEAVRKSLPREVQEETGFEVRHESLLGLLTYSFTGNRPTVPFASYVFLVPGIQGEPEPKDASEKITGFRWVPKSELEAVAEQLRHLPDDENGLGDWGRFRAIGHDFVLEVNPD